jgi:hypothetical protein
MTDDHPQRDPRAAELDPFKAMVAERYPRLARTYGYLKSEGTS